MAAIRYVSSKINWNSTLCMSDFVVCVLSRENCGMLRKCESCGVSKGVSKGAF